MTLVKQALIVQIRQNMEKAVEFKRKIDSAKTDAKKSVYKKKLKKNNIETADLFVALDKLVATQQANGDKDEVLVLEGGTSKKEGNQQPVE